MGLIGNVLGAREVAGAVGELAEVFVGNRAERDAAETALAQSALGQYAAEFQQAPVGWFDRFMNGLNRLPRPLLVAGTLGLFAYAMISPEGFARRMDSLALVPDPLWWLLGAIVSFYFGARELHYARNRSVTTIAAAGAKAGTGKAAGKVAARAAAGSAGARAARAKAEPEAAPFLGGLFARAEAEPPAIEVKAADPAFNAAIEEWRATRG